MNCSAHGKSTYLGIVISMSSFPIHFTSSDERFRYVWYLEIWMRYNNADESIILSLRILTLQNILSFHQREILRQPWLKQGHEFILRPWCHLIATLNTSPQRARHRTCINVIVGADLNKPTRSAIIKEAVKRLKHVYPVLSTVLRKNGTRKRKPV